MNERRPRRLLLLAGSLGVLALFLLGGFIAGRVLVGGDDAAPAAAEGGGAAPATPSPAAGEDGRQPAPPRDVPVAPTVGGNDPVTGLPLDPDRTKPFWALPYLEAEARLPFFEGKLAGVTIRRAGDPSLEFVRQCPPGGYTEDAAASQGTPFDVTLPELLRGAAEPVRAMVLYCADGTLRGAEAEYFVHTAPERGWYGGSLFLMRYEPFDPAEPVAPVDLRAPRVREMTVAGGPAVVAVPPLPHIGWHDGAVVVYRDGIVTVIRSAGLPLADLLVLAEQVLQPR
ncbi:hypothetical protein O0235_02935 [Tepidiforma flava]|uniref:DUF4367 domain-containing protein n=1 Tax=Tepidiforma flava TaxID=3004094 RepID=A0ABY7MAC2_9CHLR|nr:hypothetical protein [Tepidiforma flava]WBL36528.1 hypothetical protein O0235_02935 [Tepidiforma flava]